MARIMCTYFYVLILCFISSIRCVEFYPCNLYTNENTGYTLPKDRILNFLRKPEYRGVLEGVKVDVNKSVNAQCGMFAVPFDRKSKDGVNIGVFVKKLPAYNVNATKTKALWLLEGGPGGSSDSFEPLMAALSPHIPDFDIYYLEHRGVGRSNRLGCYGPQAETKGSEEGVEISFSELNLCSDEVNRTLHGKNHAYSVTEAAQDLKDVIKLVNKDQETFVYGVSYGTLWLGRFLQLPGAEDLIKGAFMDGIVSQKGTPSHPDARTSLDQWDYRMNLVGLDLLQRCESDETCLKKVKSGVDMLADVDSNLFSRFTNMTDFLPYVYKVVFEKDSCKTKKKDEVIDHLHFSQEEIKSLMSLLLMSLEGRTLIPALLFRMLRCSEQQDYGVFTFMYNQMKSRKEEALQATSPGLSSSMLGHNIVFNELWDKSVSYDELYHISNTSYFESEIYKLYEASQKWTEYVDEYTLKTYENVKIPVILINGDLDPQTPFVYAEAQYNNTSPTSPNLKLIKVPYAPHYTVGNSPYTYGKEGDFDQCGGHILIQFLTKVKDGKFPKIDLNCTNNIVPPNFVNNKEVAKVIFGTTDMWNGVTVPESHHRSVDLYVFIGVIVGVVVLAVVIICFLLYYIVQLRDKNNKYEGLEDSDDEMDAERNA